VDAIGVLLERRGRAARAGKPCNSGCGPSNGQRPRVAARRARQFGRRIAHRIVRQPVSWWRQLLPAGEACARFDTWKPNCALAMTLIGRAGRRSGVDDELAVAAWSRAAVPTRRPRRRRQDRVGGRGPSRVRCAALHT
jgi:hypothetical protein